MPVLTSWFQNPEWYAVAFSLISLIVSGYFAWRQLSLTGSTHSTFQCDSQFLEIQKLLLADPELHSFYRVGSDEDKADWDAKSMKEKKLFILAETYYFHLAFVHREWMADRVSDEYWGVYKNWIRTLYRDSEVFQAVYNSERSNFEPEFSTFLAEEIAKRG